MNYKKAKLGWMCIKSKVEGELDYFVNGTTGETSYDKPIELMTIQEKVYFDNFKSHQGKVTSPLPPTLLFVPSFSFYLPPSLSFYLPPPPPLLYYLPPPPCICLPPTYVYLFVTLQHLPPPSPFLLVYRPKSM